ncbi:MAG: twin-arginine translocation signal domain-containing protein [Opitutaceae bacterium]|jgi:hypothetical protein
MKTHSHPDLSRRDFVKIAGAAAAASLFPPIARASAARRPFEVSASLYAWDLHDEGVEQVLDNLQGMAAVNSVYLIGVMHPERRPLGGGFFPHNPVRKTWTAEDARCYWHPDLKRYGRIKPRLSDNAWLNRTDWVRTLVDAARRRGLRVGVENSHALVDKERAEGEFADLVERNIHGEITHVRTWLRPLCPNHPDVPEYAVAEFSELATTYGVDYVMSAVVSFDEGGPAQGACFCDACRRAGRDMGFDLAKARQALLADPDSQPALADWQDFRFQSTARYYRAIHDRLHALKPAIDLRYSQHMSDPVEWGVKLSVMEPHLDSVRIQDYSEQTGDPSLMPGKRRALAAARSELGPAFPIHAALGVRLKATPELIREGVRIAVETGMSGVTLGHYDGATFPMLRGVREGLVEAGVISS